jgi:hypothetical protein
MKSINCKIPLMVLVVENRGGGESKVEWASFLQNQQTKHIQVPRTVQLQYM